MVDGACRAGMLSAGEASKQLGIGGKQLRRLDGHSETFLARHNVKGGPALYDRAAISRLGDVLSQSVTPNACARQLGIPRYCVEAFASAGLVEFPTSPDATIVTGGARISKSSIAALREGLGKQSLLVEGGVALREAMRRNGDPQDWVAVFSNMLSGRVRLQLADCNSSLSDALIVGAPCIARHVSRRSTGLGISGIKIACQTAAAIIGTTPQFISAAVKVGFLDGEVGVRTSALPLDRVLTLQKQFVLTEELREIFGRHEKSISSELRRAGIKPAATINRTRVWQRSDIEKFIEKQTDTHPDGD